MFMHGGIAHIAGNMLFLWIFGDNIEDRLGHVRYLIFYLVCGLIASLAHVFTTAAFASQAEQLCWFRVLGASGAISGVLGGYILLHPTRRVTVILFRFLTQVPAYVAIGIVVRVPVDQWARHAGRGFANGRRCLRSAHRRLHRGPGADQILRHRPPQPRPGVLV